MGFRSAALQALALGALAAYVTYAFTGPLGHSWQLKDYLFVLAVAAAVFYNRMTTMKYDTLIQNEYERRKQHGEHCLVRVSLCVFGGLRLTGVLLCSIACVSV